MLINVVINSNASLARGPHGGIQKYIVINNVVLSKLKIDVKCRYIHYKNEFPYKNVLDGNVNISRRYRRLSVKHQCDMTLDFTADIKIGDVA